MSSNSPDDGSPAPTDSTVSLTAEQFSVLFQVTAQLAELPPSRWQDRGIAPEDPAALATAVRAARDLIRQEGNPDDARVTISSISSADSSACRAFLAEAPEPSAPVPICLEIPHFLATSWPALLRVVQAALGDKEMYYRTGYQRQAVEEAITALNFPHV
jgi:hypothetical protein